MRHTNDVRHKRYDFDRHNGIDEEENENDNENVPLPFFIPYVGH